VGASNRAIRFKSTLYGQGANTGLPIFGYFINKVYKDKSIEINRKKFKKPNISFGAYLDCTEYGESSTEPVFEGDDDLFGGEEDLDW